MRAHLRFEPTDGAPNVNPDIYGHFAEHLGKCIYEGIWVGEESPTPNVRGIRSDVVKALRAIKVPVVRWPGGCFADEYHWMDGIGPRAKRPGIYNSHWGGVVESNHFGTHEFLDFCDQIGAKPYVSGNVGSGTVREMQDWVEYISSDANSPMANLRRKNGRKTPWKLPFFGVGNETWGCGGNMRPEYYADLYRQHNTFIKNYSGNRVYRIASGANSRDENWTEVLMERAGRHMNGLSLHNYTLAHGHWPPSGSAIDFEEGAWIDILQHALGMDSLIKGHCAVMDKHDPDKHIGMVIDEWGTWYAVEAGTNPGFLYQQNSLRDALVAAVHFHIFHRYADRIAMTNIAQMINVLQAVILTDGPRMLRTPTYWVFDMFKVHQGGQLIPLTIQSPNYRHGSATIPAISASATKSDAVYLSLANLDPHNGAEVCAEVAPPNLKPVSARVLSASDMVAHNTFSDPDHVSPTAFTGIRETNEGVFIEMPPMSIAVVKLS
ncbi:MAG: alpha-N-arabinofuranosidase [Fimbriimonadaceae bacterium]